VHRLRRRGRRLARWLTIGFVGTLATIFIVLTQTGVTRSFVLPKIAAMLPGEVTAGGVHLGLNGDIVIEDLSLRAPGVPGEPSEFLTTRRFRISLDVFTLGSDKPRATSITLVEPVARVSVDKRTNGINLASVIWPSGGSAGELPKVFVRKGIIELGEHEGSTYDVLRRVRVDGELVPAKERDGSYTLSAREIDRTAVVGPAGEAGFIVEGKIGAAAVELTLRRLVLSDWRPESVPTIFRSSMRQLNIEGVVERATLDYDFKEGLSATLEVRGVGMNLPVSSSKTSPSKRPAAIDESHPAMRMRDVTGTIELTRGKLEARATGSLEDLPYSVRLQYLGTSADAPFVLELDAEGFELRQHPDVLRFAPEVARHWAEQFSNPTGIFDTWVEVSRGPGAEGKPGEIAVRGRARFRGVTAAFFKFPYQFNDMSGVFYFDDKAIQFRDIQGRSAQGATVAAYGTIAPPNATAEVNLDIRISGAPIDRALLEAIGPARRQIIDDLVSRAVYDDMTARGLITKAESIDEVIAAGPAESGKPPPFALGGKADVNVMIRREPGHDAPWHDQVEVTIPRVGMLPEKFRYPIIGEDVKLRIAKSRAEVVGGRFRGLRGGEAELRATLTLPDAGDTGGKVAAEVDVTASGVPVEPLLIYAVPDAALGGMDGEARNVRQLVEMLQLSGKLDCTAHIGDRPDGSMGYDVTIRTAGARAEPRRLAGPTGIVIEDLSAEVNVGTERIAVGFKGRAMRGPDPAGVLDMSVEASMGEPRPDRPPFRARLDVRGLDIASPIEDLAAIFSLDASARVLDLRNTSLPGGRVGVLARLEAPAPEHPGAWATSLTLDQADGLYFSLPEGRVILSDSTGRVLVRSGDPVEVQFEDFNAAIADDAGPIGRAGVSGSMALVDRVPRLDPAGIVLSATSLKLESPLTRGLLEKYGGPTLAELYKEYRPEGSTDARVTLVPVKDAITWTAAAIGPKSLAVDLGGRRVSFPSVQGLIDLKPAGGSFSGLMFSAPEWRVVADGAWETSADAKGGMSLASVEATYNLSSKGIPDDLVAVLPDDVAGVLRELDAGAEGGVEVQRGTLSVRRQARGKIPAGVSAAGEIKVERARLNVGVPITECDGLVRFDVERLDGAPVRFTLAADLPVLRISGVRMSQGLVRVESGAEPGRIRVPLISATCHNGRLAGDARIEPGVESQRLFDARIQLSGARFGPLLADLREESARAEVRTSSAAGAEPSKAQAAKAQLASDQLVKARAETQKADAEPDARGALDAELTLSGIIGQTSSRRGRGAARIGGGRVLNMPLTMALIRFSNFQLPIDERLELAKASFYIDGPVIGFDELAIYSRSIEISGGGTMTWPETALDMRFNSRSLSRVPVISEIIEGIRDNLITTRVRGTLDEPDIGVASPGEDRPATDRPAPDTSPPAPTRPTPAGPAGK
jgi:hypothetical protein